MMQKGSNRLPVVSTYRSTRSDVRPQTADLRLPAKTCAGSLTPEVAARDQNGTIFFNPFFFFFLLLERSWSLAGPELSALAVAEDDDCP